MKHIFKKYIPESLVLGYHKTHAYLAALWYGFPSRKMKVIGITGTKGKTTTANFTWAVLTACQNKTGLIGTANIRVGEKEYMNEYHMTMPSPWIIQKLLKQMLDDNCAYVVMEVTSEGIKQFRHFGIDFHVAVFTNISPEHLPSHNNSFEEYARTKAKLFETLKNQTNYVVTNADDSQSKYMASFSKVPVITYGIDSGEKRALNIEETPTGVTFQIEKLKINSPILGKFNVYNILPAVIIGLKEGGSATQVESGIQNLTGIPGRMEVMTKDDPCLVIIDYAHEKKSINALLDAAHALKKGDGKICIIYGAEGGGRDKRKRGEMSEAVSKKADIGIITVVDPYDDDPKDINNDIARYAESFGMVKEKNLFVIHDRRDAIRFALTGRSKNDIVLIIGKGAEQSMILPTGSIPWDDRVVTREVLKELGYGNR
jgi:UDP-N-acetylmuramoyl-L-alanyl-D-glutamate--2,6-diaminopimelate ligase